MIRLRPLVCAALACVCVPLVSSCAGTVDGTGYPSGAAPTGGTSDFPRSAAGLADLMHRGAQSIHSAHLDMRLEVAGQTLRAIGDETLENGKAKDISLTEQIPQLGTLKLIIVDGATYVQLPPAQRTSGKPWAKVSANTSDPTLRTLYESLSQSQQMASLSSTQLFVQAAGDFRFRGTKTVDGEPAGSYSLSVQIDKLPDSFPQKSTLEQAGLHSIPLTLLVDAQGRPREVTEHLSVQGQTADADATLGKFDAPVHITAPPPDQVSDD